MSVVIPLYNKRGFIRATLESVLRQKLSPVEVIVVDDGSTDCSAEQITGLPPGFVKLVSQPNAGPGPARNRGVDEAIGDWVAFLDADDLWLDDHLLELATVSEAFPEAGVVGSHFRLETSSTANNSAGEPSLVEYFGIAPPGPFCASSVAVRRPVFKGTGGFGSFWPGEDMDLWARLALDYPIAISPRTTALYRQQTGGLMDQSQGRFGNRVEITPMMNVLDAALADPKYAPRHPAIAGYHDQWLLMFARQALAAGEPKVASTYLAKMRPGSREGGPIMRILAKLPSPLIGAAMRLRAAVRGG